MGFGGRPLACRNASRAELKAYCNVLRDRAKGSIEIAMTKQIGVMDDPELELLDFMLTESARPITFIAMFDRDDISEAVRTSLRKAAPMIARGARPQTSPLAADARNQHAQSFLLRRLPVLEARVRGQVQGRAGRGVQGRRLPESISRRTEAPCGVRELGAHYCS